MEELRNNTENKENYSEIHDEIRVENKNNDNEGELENNGQCEESHIFEERNILNSLSALRITGETDNISEEQIIVQDINNEGSLNTSNIIPLNMRNSIENTEELNLHRVEPPSITIEESKEEIKEEEHKSHLRYVRPTTGQLRLIPSRPPGISEERDRRSTALNQTAEAVMQSTIQEFIRNRLRLGRNTQDLQPATEGESETELNNFERIMNMLMRNLRGGAERSQRRKEKTGRKAAKFITNYNYTTGGEQKIEVEKDSCRICLYEYKESEEIGLLPCTHSFHIECVTEWMKENPICPLCKRNIIRCGRIQYLAMHRAVPHEKEESSDSEGSDAESSDMEHYNESWEDDIDEDMTRVLIFRGDRDIGGNEVEANTNSHTNTNTNEDAPPIRENSTNRERVPDVRIIFRRQTPAESPQQHRIPVREIFQPTTNQGNQGNQGNQETNVDNSLFGHVFDTGVFAHTTQNYATYNNNSTTSTNYNPSSATNHSFLTRPTQRTTQITQDNLFTLRPRDNQRTYLSRIHRSSNSQTQHESIFD